MSYFPPYQRVTILQDTNAAYAMSSVLLDEVDRKEGCSLCGSLDHDTAECGWRDDD